MKRETLNAFEMRPELADDRERGPGSMTEYGWWEAEIEQSIADCMRETGMDRVDAIIHVFNNL